MISRIVVQQWAAWAPGLPSTQDWQDWAQGHKQPLQTGDWPALTHLDAMFKRRLSQLTRMVLHVGHELSQGQADIRVVFASQFGEVNQQYKISRSLIDSGEVAPAAFSLSVFNTPVALLSIAEKNHGYASALYGGADSLPTALLEALSLLHAHPEKPVLVLCADELLPAEYEPLLPGRNQPHAFGLLLAGSGEGTNLQITTSTSDDTISGPATLDSLSLLQWYLSEVPEFIFSSQGMRWKLSRSSQS